jgi:hypothetical protein
MSLMAALGGMGLIKGIVGGFSSASAAKTQAEAARQGIDTVKQYADQAAGYQQPYYDIGTQNLRTLNQQVAAGTYNMAPQTFQQQPFNFQTEPGYQFRLNQGTNAIQGSAAAQGKGLGGATMKALARYGQGFASNEYGNAYGRYSNDRNFNYQNFVDQYNRGAVEQNARYGRQAGMANVGVTSANMLSNIASNAGGQVADILGQRANAQAAGTIGVGNAIQSGIGGIGDYLTLSQLINQYKQPANDNYWGF